jgi:hypothetical protein
MEHLGHHEEAHILRKPIVARSSGQLREYRIRSNRAIRRDETVALGMVHDEPSFTPSAASQCAVTACDATVSSAGGSARLAGSAGP